VSREVKIIGLIALIVGLLIAYCGPTLIDIPSERKERVYREEMRAIMCDLELWWDACHRFDENTSESERPIAWDLDPILGSSDTQTDIAKHVEFYGRMRDMDIPSAIYLGLHIELERTYANWIAASRLFKQDATYLQDVISAANGEERGPLWKVMVDVGIACDHTNMGRVSDKYPMEEFLSPEYNLYDFTGLSYFHGELRSRNIDSDKNLRQIISTFKDPKHRRDALHALNLSQESCQQVYVALETLHVASETFESVIQRNRGMGALGLSDRRKDGRLYDTAIPDELDAREEWIEIYRYFDYQ